MTVPELVSYAENGEFFRVAADFLYPRPSVRARLASFAAASPVIPYAAPEYVPAFDISRWQVEVDFKAAYAGGYRLVIIKATDGLAIDPYYVRNWQEALNAGFRVNTYHFFRSNVDGAKQADYHLETVGPLRSSTKIAVWSDLETADGVTNTIRKPRFWAFLKGIYNEKIPTGPYSSNNYWQTLMDNATLPAEYWFWIAHWTTALNPTIPKGVTDGQSRLWQDAVYPTYSWGRPVPGVKTAVDNDRWRGSLQSLDEFLGLVQPEPSDEQKLSILWREAKSHGWNLNP